MPAPTARLNGYPVNIRVRDPEHPKNVAVFEPVHSARVIAQDLGPKATKQTLQLWVEGADADAQARRIAESVRMEGFSFIEDGTGAYYADGDAFLVVDRVKPTRRGLQQVDLEVGGVYVGNKATHDLYVVASAAQIANYWEIPGLVAVRVPAGVTAPLSFADATRRVLRGIPAFATHEATYAAGRRTRNGASPLACPVTSPSSVFGGVRAKIAGQVVEGIGYDLGASGTVENVALRGTFRAANADVLLDDLLYGTAQQAVTFTETYARAYHSRVNMPATLRRHVVQLDAASKPTFTFLDNGVVHIRPNGGPITFNGGGTRAMGSNLYYHTIAANRYLVGSGDFALASGVASYGAGIFGSELLTNGAFSDYPTSTGAATDWFLNGISAPQVTREATQYHAAPYATKVTIDVSDGGTRGIGHNVGLVSGNTYLVTCFAKTGGQATARCKLWMQNPSSVTVGNHDGTQAITRWEKLQFQFTAAATGTFKLYLTHVANVANDVLYFDDVSVVQVLGQGANSTNPGMVFAYVPTTETGTALQNRLREAYTDLLSDWFLEAK